MYPDGVRLNSSDILNAARVIVRSLAEDGTVLAGYARGRSPTVTANLLFRENQVHLARIVNRLASAVNSIDPCRP